MKHPLYFVFAAMPIAIAIAFILRAAGNVQLYVASSILLVVSVVAQIVRLHALSRRLTVVPAKR